MDLIEFLLFLIEENGVYNPCVATNKVIEQKCSISTKTINRYLLKLEERKYITSIVYREKGNVRKIYIHFKWILEDYCKGKFDNDYSRMLNPLEVIKSHRAVNYDKLIENYDNKVSIKKDEIKP